MKEKKMNKPNLFDFATSELSQDAFIAWLLTWSNKEYAEIDKNLNACAIDFVRKLLKKDNYNVETVKVETQWKHTDISAEVNGEYFLLIEDKTGTTESASNLKYVEMAEKHYENTNFEVVPVYFKMEEQGDYSALIKARYDIFTRQRMLSILEEYPVAVNQNDILFDYYRYLKELDEKINSYQTLPLNEWHRNSWKGFFLAIQKEISVDNWGKVDNPAGGFMGLWWHGQNKNLDDKNFDIYLQLEEKKLIFKVAVPHKKDYSVLKDDCSALRDHCRKFLYEVATEQNIQIEPYGRSGKWMGIAKLKDDYRIPKEDGTIDLSATIENLKKIERLLNAVAEKL